MAVKKKKIRLLKRLGKWLSAAVKPAAPAPAPAPSPSQSQHQLLKQQSRSNRGKEEKKTTQCQVCQLA
jgi:hypothetical protein